MLCMIPEREPRGRVGLKPRGHRSKRTPTGVGLRTKSNCHRHGRRVRRENDRLAMKSECRLQDAPGQYRGGLPTLAGLRGCGGPFRLRCRCMLEVGGGLSVPQSRSARARGLKPFIIVLQASTPPRRATAWGRGLKRKLILDFQRKLFRRTPRAGAWIGTR